MLETKDPTVVNYHKLSLQEIEKIKALDTKPKLLLHACCGPCACYPIDWLHDLFDVTIYYENSNIYPAQEYHRRKDELIEHVLPHYPNVKLIVPDYDNSSFTQELSIYKDEPERGKRCWLCYQLRLEKTLEYASNHGFDYVCTTLTISRMKDSQVINQIARLASSKYPTIKYFYSDFKKNKGLEVGNALAREYNCYRQDYCGCVYSYVEKEKRNQSRASVNSINSDKSKS